jgi:hypothetical protein
MSPAALLLRRYLAIAFYGQDVRLSLESTYGVIIIKPHPVGFFSYYTTTGPVTRYLRKSFEDCEFFFNFPPVTNSLVDGTFLLVRI